MKRLGNYTVPLLYKKQLVISLVNNTYDGPITSTRGNDVNEMAHRSYGFIPLAIPGGLVV